MWRTAGAIAEPGLAEMDKKQVAVKVQDNPLAVEVYANKFLGAFFDGNSVTLTFGSMRIAPQAEEGAAPTMQPIVHVTQRLVLSPAAIAA